MLAQIGVSPVSETQNDKVFLERLKKLYESNKNLFIPTNVSDMWQDTFVPLQQKLFNCFEANNDLLALELLNNMMINELTCGYYSWSFSESDSSSPPELHTNKLFLMDSLLGFAEWLNVVPMESIDLDAQRHYISLEPDYFFDLIDKKLGVKFKVPTFQDKITGLSSSKGVFSNRHIIYFYLALRIKEFCKYIENPRICEIGGGIGLLAYYLNLLGIKDVTLIDTPSVSFISSYWMMKNLPDRKFILSDDEDKYNSPDAIKVLFPEYFNNAPDNQFDLVINCDSMPEINPDIVREYLNNIKRTSKMFYSINHEWHQKEFTERNVPNLTEEVGGFDKVFRNMFALRRGYAEEFYRVKR